MTLSDEENQEASDPTAEKGSGRRAAMVGGEKVLGTLVALSIAKKVTVYTVARVYGFPKLYRRLARLTNTTVSSPGRRDTIRSSIKVRAS
jgi:hypothetical protein